MYISCPTCSQRLQVPDDAAGKKVACAKCGQRILVPTPHPVPSSALVTAKPPIATFADPGKPAPQSALVTRANRVSAHSFKIVSLLLGCVAGLFIVIAGLWAMLAGSGSSNVGNAGNSNQSAANPKDKPTKFLEPPKKEYVKEPNADEAPIAKNDADKEPTIDPPIAKKEPDNTDKKSVPPDAKEAETLMKLAKAAQEKAEAAEKRAAELLAKVEELEKKNELDRRKIAAETAKAEKEIAEKRQELATLKKEIEAERKKADDRPVARLINDLKSSDPKTRETAALALKNSRAMALEALPDLVEASCPWALSKYGESSFIALDLEQAKPLLGSR
jgi:DNA-directed RNA polymerase subunit RPC12/RpoP